MSTALVTGGISGIGRAIAIRLAQDGADVAIADINAELAEDTLQSIRSFGRRAFFFKTDVADGAQVAACIDAVEQALGPITAFVNNAGIEGVVCPIQDYPDDVFDRLMDVNVRGTFLGMKHILARMIPRGSGAIVNIASTSAIRGRAALAGYVASKHAVLGLTRVAALDVAGTGIRVNAVLPGPVETRMIRSLDEQAASLGGIQRAGSAAAYGTPDQVASVVCFLLSDQAAHVNGAALTVDGGISVQ